ncbi:MAG: hypothetical protein CM15mP102_10060 [Flavobacteriales bacterium]|nr:MAG: hypothetical protein CM15mP102_10060 [Flavobacteriales bacterium]
MKRILSTVFLLFALLSYGQSPINGVVSDENGVPYQEQMLSLKTQIQVFPLISMEILKLLLVKDKFLL